MYFALAFLLSLGVIAAMLLLSRAAKQWPARMFQLLMYSIVLASVVTVGLSGRTLRLVDQALAISGEGDMSGFIGGKILLVMAIGIAMTMIAAWFTQPWWRNLPFDRFGIAGKKPPNDLSFAFLVFYVMFSLVPFVFAPDHYFHVSLLYPFFIFLALFLWLRFSEVDPILAIRNTLIVLVCGSLLAAVFAPTLALQPGYAGLIPGFTHRLWGLTASANTLGAAAMALFLLEVCEPSKRKIWRVVLLISALTALVMSQSKAALVVGVLGAVGLWVYRWHLQMQLRDQRGGNKGQLLVIVAFVAMVLVFVGVTWMSVADPSIFGRVSRKLNAQALDSLSTATGRTDIWSLAIKSGLESPIYGQGGNFWSAETRLRTGLTGASHAHNQFLQVFSRSGFLGLISYGAFLYLLVVYAWRAKAITRGGSILFVSAFLVRSMVEVPLQPNSVLGGEFFAFMAMFVYVADRGAKRDEESVRSARLNIVKFG
ncbi:O-antigen ligase family protein [Paucibacter sp. TC2R-5]|uniref:O-antigen ligase family protein n=1 Tax=Paucibacter sp. TC2R-5 TaxID=2893555 RepID=UPI0021E47D1B|nr:O-antigen ligase family protein [Paucibacter sp. TC2R-5]MCV2360219.1 O-antigen ligase family protein [Paucibacter sp. TC2R-5]